MIIGVSGFNFTVVIRDVISISLNLVRSDIGDWGEGVV